jgi:hypothetical protein
VASGTTRANVLGRRCIGIRTIRFPLASPENGLSLEPPGLPAADAIDLLWGVGGGRSTTGHAQRLCRTRSSQPSSSQEVRRRNLIVRSLGGFPGKASVGPERVFRAGIRPRAPCGFGDVHPLSSDSLPGRKRASLDPAFPAKVAETAKALGHDGGDVLSKRPAGAVASGFLSSWQGSRCQITLMAKDVLSR